MKKDYLRAGLLVLLVLLVVSCGGTKKSAETTSETTLEHPLGETLVEESKQVETFTEDTVALALAEQEIEALRKTILDNLRSWGNDVDYEKLIPEYNDLIEQNKRRLPFKFAVGSTDKNRAKVIWVEDDQNVQVKPSDFTHCIIAGKVFEVKFIRKQEGKESEDGEYSVDNEEGYLYEITGGKIVPGNTGATVLMCSKEFVSAHTFIPTKYESGSHEDTPPQYTDGQLRDLELIKTVIKQRYEQGIETFSVRSVSEDGKIRSYSLMINMKSPVVLGLTVISDDGKLLFGEDFAVKDEMSTWRAGDGGHYEGHSLIFAFRDKGGTLNLFFISQGSEGANYFTMYQRGERLIQRAYMASESYSY
ncbi:Uncharacterised protein [Porphyromonas cangingivalis]|uniref:hypothetical protein n=1 Tax=Porphyromonas cangingivalis TaxID=36874 RepID=UPI000D8D6512|nr:hypothetical protein [Porphyromonas cangingivalis]SPY36011.1 Uncharacterised protein [Porphyromonas cangingivalis]